MTNVNITNGTIKYGRTIKTGDFESKRGDVELSFAIAEGTDADEAITAVELMAIKHVFDILGHKEDGAVRSAAPATKEKPGKAPKMPTAKPVADAAAMEDPAAQEFLSRQPAAVQEKITEAVKAQNHKAAEAVPEENLDDLLGEDSAPAAREITDKELTDATQKCQSAVKNAPAIRKILTELGIKAPPGRIIDLPQDKRQTYLDELLKVKPLA